MSPYLIQNLDITWAVFCKNIPTNHITFWKANTTNIVPFSPDSKIHGANMGPPGSCRPPCWPHELYYWGSYVRLWFTIRITWPNNRITKICKEMSVYGIVRKSVWVGEHIKSVSHFTIDVLALCPASWVLVVATISNFQYQLRSFLNTAFRHLFP